MKLPSVRRLLFHARRIAPDALPIIGGVLCIASPIVAAIETHKHYEELVKDHRERMNQVKEAEEILKSEGKEMPKKDKFFCKLVNWFKTFGKAAKVYAAPAFMAILGTLLMFYGKCAFKAQYLGASAAASSLAAENRELKARAYDILSEEQADAVVKGVRKDVITIDSTDENGNTTSVTETRSILGRKLIGNHPKRIGAYTFVIDKDAHGIWDTDPSYVLSRIRNVQAMMNDRFQIDNFVYLNDVLRELKLDLVPDGYTIGWSKYAGSVNIDFGINDQNEKCNVALVNQSTEYKNCCVLDFNCVGDIRNKMYAYQLTDKYAPPADDVIDLDAA